MDGPHEPWRKIILELQEDVWFELVKQARQCGYYGGKTTVYLEDRIKQLVGDNVYKMIPRVSPKGKLREERKRPPFIAGDEWLELDDETGHYVERKKKVA